LNVARTSPARKRGAKKFPKGPETPAPEKNPDIEPRLIPIYVMGRRYNVPEGLTIMKALEYAGFQFIRGCGCRGGICGACGTVYRKPGDYRISTGLACQNVVEPDMMLTQLPFYPANRAVYDLEKIKPVPEEIFRIYPEAFRCLGCNACTRVCPMEVPVMDVVSALKQGNITEAAFLSFNCIQCGLCASRCMGELPQYHIFQLARRIYGAKIAPRAAHLKRMVKKVTEGRYEAGLKELMNMESEALKKLYQAREIEPMMAPEDWKPADDKYL
jgi:formate hydrogenlyase subunit 6/NADH:ubiquinone oxidoreductase subunit I